MAFVQYKPGFPLLSAPFVGFKHFKFFIIGSGEFGRIMRNTLVFNIVTISLDVPLQITLAIIIYELRFKVFKRITQTISYLPYFVSWAIVAGLFFQVFSYEGFLNSILQALGITDKPILFLADAGLAIPILVTTRIWKGLGFNTIIYLGAMGGIDPNLYEAAYVDGAARLKRIWHITLPGLAPTISVILIMSAGALINGSFEQVYLFQNPINFEWADTVDTLVYRYGLGQGQFSFATAVGMFNTVCSLALLTIVNTVVKRINGRSLI
jgi:putative aldouronate transport system permease protein